MNHPVSPHPTPVCRDAALASEERPWGSFDVLKDEPHYKLKVLRVMPGHRLSLQMHHKREEHWIVTHGTPEITLNDETFTARPGQYIHIPCQARHRIANASSEPAELVEVQLGSYFGEDDIVRFQDDYDRATPPAGPKAPSNPVSE